MPNFWGKSEEIETSFDNLTKSVKECLFSTLDLIGEYIENGENEKVKNLCEIVHRAESEADEHRRAIVNKLVQGSLMPHTREDLMKLVEEVDDIADNAEKVMDLTLFIALDLTQLNKEQVKKMNSQIKKQYNILQKAVSDIFQDMSQALGRTGQLENIESIVDDQEEKIIREIGRNKELELAEKIPYQNTVIKLSDLADTIENAGDVIEILIATRRG